MPREETIGRMIVAGCILMCLIIIYWVSTAVRDHFAEYIYGFWCGETVDGACIIYLDRDGDIHLTESNEVMNTTSMAKGQYTLNSQSTFGMSMRSYSFSVNDWSRKTSIGQRLSQPNLSIDLYPIEGTLIIYGSDGDIITLVKDNKSNIELLL